MTAQIATTASPPTPQTPYAHAVTMATLVTETAVVISTTNVRPVAITVREKVAGPFPWEVTVQVDTATQVDEIGRVFALPVIDYAETLRTRAWDGVNLAGALVTVRVYGGAA